MSRLVKFLIAFIVIFLIFGSSCANPEVIPATFDSNNNPTCPNNYDVFYDGKGDVEVRSNWKCRLRK